MTYQRGVLLAMQMAEIRRMIEDAIRRPPPNTVLGAYVQSVTQGVGGPTTVPPHSHVTGDIFELVEFLQDQVAAYVRAGANVSIVYDDAAGTLTWSVSTPPLDTEAVQDIVADLIHVGSNMVKTYDDAANTLTLDSIATGGGVPPPPDTYAYVVDASGNYVTDAAGNYIWVAL